MPERPRDERSRKAPPDIADQPEQSTEGDSTSGLVVAVFGARGGVGVSAIATSLARELRSAERQDVALAELDPRAVRARRHALRDPELTLTPSGPIDDRDRLPIPDLDAAMVRAPDGVWTLVTARPRVPAVSDVKSVATALDMMRRRFPVSVLELEHQVNERTLAAFDAADRILFVTEGSVPSIRGTQRVLRLCQRLNYPDEKMCVVVNRVGAPGSLPVADVSAALRREVYWRIADGHLTTAGLGARLLSE